MDFTLLNPGPYLPLTTDITSCSVDPGIKNLAIRIETRSATTNKVIVFQKINLNMDNHPYYWLGRYLLYYFPVLSSYHFIIIERQLNENYQVL